ncbi:glyoxalase family protein [Gracilibacillus boraciitolerans JCM 21714]|uniref:Glyoxalase family protein n=1 Tax=Gracilibacillus boraciitolerans JCM 21714 TaxID=1298598 RepID=W4VJ31_9BACI|nr:glyoxalase family protein [Gracilibacillus boraciitolerans JCM 21714]
MISDENNQGVPSGTPWQDGPIPNEYAITGLGPITVRIKDFKHFNQVMEKVLLFKNIDHEGSYHLFEVGEGGNGAQVIVEENDDLPMAQQGYGTVHHAAFRIDDLETLHQWDEHYRRFGFQTSGYVDRFFFKSLYTRVAPQILFELATDGPGFMGDEPYETLGEKLSLPPFLENKRKEIVGMVRHIDTVRSSKELKKEYE